MSGLKESRHLKISLKEIEMATKNFKVCIGKGGYGLVYKGELFILGKLTTVAVKRLNEQFGQGLKEFLTEIQLLSGQDHPNLISLLGYCEEGKEKIIVYEYAERGSLDQYLRSGNTNYSLTWLERLKICVDAARGLDHLHNHVGKHQTIIHRDIKSANILIDHKWVAKISDLGLSKLSFAGLNRSAVISHVCGTRGYCEPEYFDTGIVKKESDVYSFGMVLFEVFCGRLCSVRGDDGFLLSCSSAKDYYIKKKFDEIVDPSLREQMRLDSMNTFLAIAYKCLHEDRGQRPPMDLVVKGLEESLKIQNILGPTRMVKDVPLQHMPQIRHRDAQSYVALSDSRIEIANNQRLEGVQLAPDRTTSSVTLDVEDLDIPWTDMVLKEKIGAGSFGTVHRAEWNGSVVAVKLLCDHVFRPWRLKEFSRQVATMSGLRHPNIVHFMGVVTQPPNMSIITEYLPRGSLFTLLHTSGANAKASLNERRRLRMAFDVANGMNYLHTCDPPIVHGNLKSANLLVNKIYTLKVCDFGLSRFKANNSLSSKYGAGTLEWMAPEVLLDKPSNEKSDVYSFGVILWELATLQQPWSNLNPAQVVLEVGCQCKRLEIPHDVDRQVAALIEACWADDPSKRPSFSSIMDCLRPLILPFTPLQFRHVDR